MPTHFKPEATYIDMHALSQRLRGKAMLLMDVDTDFACDLICASYFIDDHLPSRLRWIDEIVPLSVR